MLRCVRGKLVKEHFAPAVQHDEILLITGDKTGTSLQPSAKSFSSVSAIGNSLRLRLTSL
jgi:hypothetical protein